jgi:PTH1 family peptidyl-tRNA hydrolase
MSDRYLIVGLGNPGREYEDTRHNIGFRCVDALAKAHGLTYDAKKRSKAKTAEGTIAGKRALIAKPQAFMNLSGASVQGLAAFYQIPPERIIVLFDDLDLPPGTLRIRQKGGSGGHRGLTDIIQRLGTQDFPRIRVGIGRPPGKMDPAAFVLQRFSADELPLIEQVVDRASKAIETWIAEGIDASMNRYNGTLPTLLPDQSN